MDDLFAFNHLLTIVSRIRPEIEISALAYARDDSVALGDWLSGEIAVELTCYLPPPPPFFHRLVAPPPAEFGYDASAACVNTMK